MKTRHGIVAVTCTALPLAATSAAAVRGNVQKVESTAGKVGHALFEEYRYTPKQIDPDVAAGGLELLVESAVFRRLNGKEATTTKTNKRSKVNEPRDKREEKVGHVESDKTEKRKLQLRTGVKTTTGTNTEEDTTRSYGSYEGKAWSPTYDDDDGSYYYGDDAGVGDDDVAALYDDDASYIDDTFGAEEVLYVSAFQDLRTSSPTPIYVTPDAPDPAATGNLWVYAEAPLQSEFGIGVEALLGQVHGTCQSTFQNLNGFCSFTYEFFDGGPEVVASMTVEGATQPYGPTILTVSGGDGELAGVSGEVQLTPVTLDDTFVPPLLTTDDSTLFLGNPVGYLMEAVVYVRFRVADVVDDLFFDDQLFPEEPSDDLSAGDDLLAGDDFLAGDDLVAGDDLAVADELVAGDDLAVADELVAGDDLAVGDELVAGDDLAVGDDLVAGDDLAVGDDLVAGDDISVGDGVAPDSVIDDAVVAGLPVDDETDDNV